MALIIFFAKDAFISDDKDVINQNQNQNQNQITYLCSNRTCQKPPNFYSGYFKFCWSGKEETT